MSTAEQFIILGKILFSACLGGAIGVERELARKAAGFRTHMLLALAATLLVSVAAAFIKDTRLATSPQALQSDPLRIIEAIVAGVAFIGAGTILRSQQEKDVEGLTTAGSLLLVAAIGITVALELYWLASLTTLLALAILRVLALLEHKIKGRAASKALGSETGSG